MPPAPLYGDQQWLDRGIDALGIKESIFVRPEFRTGEVIKQFLMYGCTNVSVCVCFSIPGWGIAGLMLASHETYYGFLAQHFESCLVCLKTIYECGVVQNLE